MDTIDIRLDDLPLADTASRFDVLPTADEGATKLITIEQILQLIELEDIEALLGAAAFLDVGVGADNVAAGDDSRFSDARDWTASVVSQAEAEAGVATTARKWTAQRVAQAIAARSGGQSAGPLTPSGTSFDFTSIPAGTQEILLGLAGVAISTLAVPILRLGTSSGIVSTGYVSQSAALATGVAVTASSAGFVLDASASANLLNGVLRLTRSTRTSNRWFIEGSAQIASSRHILPGGYIDLADELTQLRLTTVAGTPTFSGSNSVTLRWR
ncbi:hypothetical protein [Shinella zoogloeoides]|uniref:hypothetical protein n=1 Tax=Shinella zoogloeoides TaxID=352475 RepID=UPI0028B11F8A|nr:hypothetical protein [Shinella zoogloeoides]